MAVHTEAGSFSRLDPAIQRLEFKLTVPPAEEPMVHAELGRAAVDPVRRKVYFYDTPELALFAEGLVLRARVTAGEDDDSTVKLRPLHLPAIPPPWRNSRIELDVVGGDQVASAKLDGKPERDEIEQVARGALKLGKLFSKAQERCVASALPKGNSLDDLAVLGPVDARKWEIPPGTFPHKLCVEEWSMPDGTHFLELSFKVEPEEAERADQAFRALLGRMNVGPKGDPEPKTPRVLRFFARRLRSR